MMNTKLMTIITLLSLIIFGGCAPKKNIDEASIPKAMSEYIYVKFNSNSSDMSIYQSILSLKAAAYQKISDTEYVMNVGEANRAMAIKKAKQLNNVSKTGKAELYDNAISLFIDD